MVDGRIVRSEKIKKQNKQKIKKWYLENPNKTMKQCQEELGLSHVTVRAHLRELGFK